MILWPSSSFNDIRSHAESRLSSEQERKLNNFIHWATGLDLSCIRSAFRRNIGGGNYIINAIQTPTLSLELAVRAQIAREIAQYNQTDLTPAIIPFETDLAGWLNNAEKYAYRNPILFTNQWFSDFVLWEQDAGLIHTAIDGIRINETEWRKLWNNLGLHKENWWKVLSEYWRNLSKQTEIQTDILPDITHFFSEITRMILEKESDCDNNSTSLKKVMIRLPYGECVVLERKKQDFVWMCASGDKIWFSRMDLIQCQDAIRPMAKYYYPYIYLVLASTDHMIIDYEMWSTGLLEDTEIKKLRSIIERPIGLLDLGSFHQGIPDYVKQVWKYINTLPWESEWRELIRKDPAWVALQTLQISKEVNNLTWSGCSIEWAMKLTDRAREILSQKVSTICS